MGRLRENWNEENRQDYSVEEQYIVAHKKVKQIKGFYSHLKIYLIVNLFIIISSVIRNFIGSSFDKSSLFEWHNYSTALYWGIAIVVHWFSVFGLNLFLSNEWEERKIKEFMEKESKKGQLN